MIITARAAKLQIILGVLSIENVIFVIELFEIAMNVAKKENAVHAKKDSLSAKVLLNVSQKIILKTVKMNLLRIG